VRDVRSLSVVVCLNAAFVLSQISSGTAASADHKANASYRSNTSSQTASVDDVPPNCVRQSCGKLWCWQMRGKSGSH
jgi:hypothetical protein